MFVLDLESSLDIEHFYLQTFHEEQFTLRRIGCERLVIHHHTIHVLVVGHKEYEYYRNMVRLGMVHRKFKGNHHAS